MFKNYLYLLRAVAEIKSLIINQKIIDIYTQEKDKLFISVPLKEKENFHLVISANSQLSYIEIKEAHSKAKKNTKDFFREFLPDTIHNLEIALHDRIIKISLSNSSLFFSIKGPNTNVYLVDNNKNIFPFKKTKELTKENIIVEELLNHTYLNSYKYFLNEICNMSDEEILNNCKFIDKHILNEYKIRNNTGLKNLIAEFFNKEIRISIEPDEGIIKFEPESFYITQNFITVNKFNNYSNALKEYIKLFYKLNARKKLYSEIEKYVNLEIERLSNKINSVKAIIESGSKENYYINIGNLLLINIHKLRKGMKEIELINEVGNKCKINLDEKLPPHKNIDKYFEKAKEEKSKFEKSISMYNELVKNYNYLLELKSKLINANDDELLRIKKELKIKSSTDKNKTYSPLKFRHYIIENKFHIYVGKDSQSNDELTLKFAKQNDYWFHARGTKGSHVVLRVENPKESIPKSIINKTASIAAYYSKAKTANLVPVSFTQKKYVVKRKGMNPGEVSLLREEVVIVKPEIPPNCELQTE